MKSMSARITSPALVAMGDAGVGGRGLAADEEVSAGGSPMDGRRDSRAWKSRLG